MKQLPGACRDPRDLRLRASRPRRLRNDPQLLVPAPPPPPLTDVITSTAAIALCPIVTMT